MGRDEASEMGLWDEASEMGLWDEAEQDAGSR